jgi:hypothetical protein
VPVKHPHLDFYIAVSYVDLELRRAGHTFGIVGLDDLKLEMGVSNLD